MEQLRVQGGDLERSNCTSEILKLLRNQWKKLLKYKKDVEKKRETFLDQCMSDAVKENEEVREKHIAEIKKQERCRRRFRKIKRVLHKVHGPGMMSLDAPVADDNGDIVGWETLTRKKEVHDKIISRNDKHLSQATNTPFGSGEGYERLTGD